MVDLDELDRLHASLVAAYGRGYPRDEVDTTAYALSLLNAYPALSAEVRALREVVAAAHELARWDWLPLLVDDPNAADVRDGVAQVRAALAKVPR